MSGRGAGNLKSQFPNFRPFIYTMLVHGTSDLDQRGSNIGVNFYKAARLEPPPPHFSNS